MCREYTDVAGAALSLGLEDKGERDEAPFCTLYCGGGRMHLGLRPDGTKVYFCPGCERTETLEEQHTLSMA